MDSLNVRGAYLRDCVILGCWASRLGAESPRSRAVEARKVNSMVLGAKMAGGGRMGLYGSKEPLI